VEKGRKYAAMYGIPESSIYIYEQFDRLRENKAVDAVYIGLPNSMHCEYTVRAAEAGKHVLCEKPMAISSDECRKMIAACKRADRRLMVAYRVQYDPTWNAARDIVRSGDLGRIESFAGGWYTQMPAGQWRLTKKLGGGGSLMDIGIYPLNAIRWLAGAEPTMFTAQVSTTDRASGRFTEVEESVNWTMKWPSGLLASCGSSYGARSQGSLDVQAEKGWLRLEPAYYYDGARLTGQIGSRKIDVGPGGVPPFQFVAEADHFSECVRTGRMPRSPGEDGLGDLVAIEAIYRAAGTPIA
jgi:predicted dehydrogenase